MEIFNTVNFFDQLMKETQDALAIVPQLMVAYIETLKGYEEVRVSWKSVADDCRNLSTIVMDSHRQIEELGRQVQTVRRLMDEEKRKRKRAEDERDSMGVQLDKLREILMDKKGGLDDDAKEKLSLLSLRSSSVRLSTITEMETTESVMSDLSYTRDEEDFAEVSPSVSEGKPRSRKRSGSQTTHQESRSKKKKRPSSDVRLAGLKPSDRIVATTTVTVNRAADIQATAVIQARSPRMEVRRHTEEAEDEKGNPSSTSRSALKSCESEDRLQAKWLKEGGSLASSVSLKSRAHKFQHKTILKNEICYVCSKRITFSTSCLKCKICKTACHVQCADFTPLPCIPRGDTPKKRGGGWLVSDYAPMLPPMVPPLVVHCINEVEARGLSEVGLYRICGADKDIKALKEKFLRGKATPNLSQVMDTHVICGCLKEFLRSLKDSLTTKSKWSELAKAVECDVLENRQENIYKIIGDLPLANRDTLAIIVLHLQTVADKEDVRMPIENLAKVFGPTLVGYSCKDPGDVFSETEISNKVLTELLSLPRQYWESFLQEAQLPKRIPSATSVSFFSPQGMVRPLTDVHYFESP